MLDAQLPGQWKEYTASFTVTNGTLAKILVDVAPANIPSNINPVNGPSAIAEIALPGDGATLRQRILTGGQRVIDGSISSTDGTARSALIYIGQLTTSFASMGAPTVTGTNTINRTSGSFIADGYQIGDAIMGFGFTNTANNGLLGVVTGVTALALTLNGTAFTNETIPAGFRLFRVALRTRRGIPLNSGNTDSAPAVQLIGGSQDPAAFPAPDTGISLDVNGVIIVAMVAAISALPAQVNFSAHSALY